MPHFRYVLSSVLAALVLAPVAIHASSVAGDTFSTAYYFPDPSTVVQKELNFIADGSTHTSGGNGADYKYRITGTQVILIFTDTPEIATVAPFNGVEFTDLSQSLANYSIAFDPASTYTDFALAAYSLSGSTIFINLSGLTLTPDQTAIYDITPNVATTPEPSSLVLLGTGVLAGAGVIRRRLFA